MPSYQDFNLDADPAQLQQDAEDSLQAQAPAGYVIPVWVSWILSAVARIGVEVVVLAGRIPVEIFKTFGQRILGVQPIAAIAATGTATFAVTDTSVLRTISAGAQINVEGVGFESTVDLVLAQGGPTTGSVPIVAIEAGVAGNGLQDPAVLVSPTYVFVNSVTLPAPTDGGVDDEDDDAFVDRLADSTPTLSRKAILIPDFAALARDDAEVERALALDNLNYGAATGTATTASGSANLTLVTPTTGWANGMLVTGIGIAPGTTVVSGAGTATMVMSANATASASGVAITGSDTNAEGHVTVAVVNAAGGAVSPAGKARVLASLNANRVLNLVPHVVDPAFSQIDVTWAATSYPGYDATATRDAGNQAISDFLNPAQWGNPRGSGDQFQWIDEPLLRRNDLFGVLYTVPGLRHVDTLTIGFHGGSLGTTDLTLASPAAIPVANTISGTVTPT